MPTVEQLVTLAKATLLELGGVEDWDWYSVSLENYGYTPSTDEFEDAEALLDALEAGGVDNWDWYGESLTDLSRYKEYLESLPNLDEALDVYSWQEREKSAVVETVPVEVEPVVEEQKHTPEGVAAEQVYAHIVKRFGSERAGDVYHLAIENGLWKQSTFPKEFKVALKEIVAGVKNPLEMAKRKLVSLIVKNGKLDVFLDGLV
jgi:hypothetical protein